MEGEKQDRIRMIMWMYFVYEKERKDQIGS